MAHVSQLPCNGDGICMQCEQFPVEEEKLICNTCATPWHVSCLSCPPESLSAAAAADWTCPDCSCEAVDAVVASSGIVKEMLVIEADTTLTEAEKARRRQVVMCGKGRSDGEEESEEAAEDTGRVVLETIQCMVCFLLAERPVSTPCGHTFCLKCFQRWIGKGKKTCAQCRTLIPAEMASDPRIDIQLVAAIRVAKTSLNESKKSSSGSQFVHNQDRPDKAYTTDRAKKKGHANAASGKIFVNVTKEYFGPILAEHDPMNNEGVLVGSTWAYRMDCRQYGVHFPSVAGIGGQHKRGAQSVVLSGGYVDDEDHGEWFLYTGSGGRDLTGNKRTNKDQSFDQKFEKKNEALRLSCMNGYPVRVLRSSKEKRSPYAPKEELRYDGIYRIEQCWRKVGQQGFKVCRYLFVRCDNEPAPWTSDDHGDRPRPLPAINELENASDICSRTESPSWDYNEEDGLWKWVKPPPPWKMASPNERKRAPSTIEERLLKEFGCLKCKKVMSKPVTTPCAHSFCKSCLQETFAGTSFVRERAAGGRTLRKRKNIMKCPACPNDLSDFLQGDPQVNITLMQLIESSTKKLKKEAPGDAAAEDEIPVPVSETSEEEESGDISE